VVDNQKLQLVKGAPNFLLANWYNAYAAQTQLATIASASVTTGAAVSSMAYPANYITAWDGQSEPFSIAVLGNQQLGTDTATVSVHRMYKLVAAITHNAPSPAVSNTLALQSWQGTNANQVSQTQVAHTFSSGATSGNPTIGEFATVMNIITVVGTTAANALASRLAVADGVFSAFTVTSSASLLINWLINYPTP
jgi:hypothetical protein